jgi:hypothetical protein
MRKTL